MLLENGPGPPRTTTVIIYNVAVYCNALTGVMRGLADHMQHNLLVELFHSCKIIIIRGMYITVYKPTHFIISSSPAVHDAVSSALEKYRQEQISL